MSEWTMNSMNLDTNNGAEQEFLKVLTEPFTKLIIQVCLIDYVNM